MVSAWSIGTSQRSGTKVKDTPGPGAYTPNQHHNKTPSQWKFGSDKTRNKKYFSKNPGPSQYTPQNSMNQTMRQFPSYKFGGKSSKHSYNENPGPNSYLIKANQTQREFPRFTFGLKHQSFLSSNQLAPGPANYEINRDESVVKRPSTKIGNSRRRDLYDNNKAPGVGKYEVTKQIGDGTQIKFGSQSRIQSAKSNFTPGPGAYNSFSQLKNAPKTMGNKYQNGATKKEQAFDPSPFSYYVDDNLTKRGKVGWKMGSGKRGKLNQEALKVPAPNHYNPHSVDRRQAATYSIGNQSRNGMKNQDNPGPGQYLISTTIGSGAKYVIGEKTSRTNLQSGPGPQDYLSNADPIKVRPASCKMGRPGYKNNNYEHTPGPGAYTNLNSERGPAYKFSRDESRRKVENVDIPGPGTYTINPSFADVPQYLIQSQKNLD